MDPDRRTTFPSNSCSSAASATRRRCRPTIQPPTIVQTHLEIVNNFAAADLNDDGNADLVAAAAGREGEAAKLTTQIMLGHGDGTFDEPQVYHAGAEDVWIADLNGDGVLDLAVTRDSGTDTVQALAAFIGRGDGTFHDPETHALIEPYPAVDIDAADLDGDRRADVVVTVGQYSGSRGAVTLLAAKPGLQDAASGDINGDGYLDLLAANAANGHVKLLLGQGDDTFDRQYDLLVGRGPVALLVADLNRDQHLDVVTANQNADSVSMLLGDGAGGLRARTRRRGHAQRRRGRRLERRRLATWR